MYVFVHCTGVAGYVSSERSEENFTASMNNFALTIYFSPFFPPFLIIYTVAAHLLAAALMEAQHFFSKGYST